jgi:hypothetical protein
MECIILKLVFGFFLVMASVLALASEETYLSSEFKISSIEYRGSNSANSSRYLDCNDCMLIEGTISNGSAVTSSGCGIGFVIQGANSGNDEAKFMASLAMMAYASKKTVVMGREHCVKWNDAWRGHANRLYIKD